MLNGKRTRMLLTSLGGLGMLMAGVPATAAKFHAIMNGNKEVTGGDPNGWGRVKIEIDDSSNRLCADVETRAVGAITGVYIFRGIPADKSEPVVKLDTPKDNDSDDCDTIGDALADEIQANPSNFYVSVLTAQHPAGALAGKLIPGEKVN